MKQRNQPVDLALAVTCGFLLLTPCLAGEAQEEDGMDARTPSVPAAELATKWGIQIAGLRLAGQGYMIDFRYKILAPEKAAPLVKHENKPCLIDEKTHRKFLVPSVPKLGSLRQTSVKLIEGRTYGIMFANPARVVKAGSKVTVVVGDCRLENLTVE